MSKYKTIATWVVIALLAAAFGAAGVAKLMGVEMLHQSFANMGLPPLFGYFIGACEVLGAVALWVRKYSALAASGLILIMLGAIGYHIAFDPIVLAMPAVILATLATIVFFGRKRDSILVAIH
ncbi:MAG: DoxX family protein [Pseudomonadales bacterium]|nr:DoxX family protein [Pseudomonadales bacterium]NRA16701.1 DoxX family protein [Oceanospirillaceae bacterium]